MTATANPMRTSATPRSPRGHWLTGHLRPFQRDRLGFLTECARTYGDMVDLRLGPMRGCAIHFQGRGKVLS